jgi:hypothetical protein
MYLTVRLPFCWQRRFLPTRREVHSVPPCTPQVPTSRRLLLRANAASFARLPVSHTEPTDRPLTHKSGVRYTGMCATVFAAAPCTAGFVGCGRCDCRR